MLAATPTASVRRPHFGKRVTRALVVPKADSDTQSAETLGTSGVVALLERRLQALDDAELPPAERVRLSATLADALLRAIQMDVLDKRLEAVHAVLSERDRLYKDFVKEKDRQ